MGTKVYRYGLLAPEREDEAAVREQLRLAHRYRNQLIEIERWRRSELRTLLSSHGSIPDLEAAVKAADAEVLRIVTSAKEAKAVMRTRMVSPDHRDALKAAREAKKVATTALREARAALHADPSIEKRRDEISIEANERLKKARAACGVYWGTYLLIEDAAKQSAKMPLYDKYDKTKPNDPRFVRWSGEGTLGVQIQGGITASELATSLHARVEDAPLPPGADPQSKKSAKRRYCTLSLRIGSEERAPVWARWRMLMHRPMPADGVVKRAAVHVRRIGPREEWYALFTVTSEAETRPAPASQSRIAIDLGWRKLEDGGVRVATWRTDGGEHGFLVLSAETLSMGYKADELQKTRRENFNHFLPRIVEAVKPLSKPEWWPTSLWQWKSQERLHKLVRFWGQNRFEGDEEAYLLAEGIHDKERRYESWRYHDQHLWEWETSQRENAMRHRREIYRRFAAWAARSFASVVLEKDLDLREFAQRPAVDEHEGDNERARANRQRAAPSECRNCIRQAFGTDRIVEVPKEFTTMRCHACGSIEQWDQAAEVEHTCGACGAQWDQDDNACLNLLAYREQPGGAERTGVARADGKPGDSKEVAESRWTKAKRMGAEKAKRMEAAREAVPTAAE